MFHNYSFDVLWILKTVKKSKPVTADKRMRPPISIRTDPPSLKYLIKAKMPANIIKPNRANLRSAERILNMILIGLGHFSENGGEKISSVAKSKISSKKNSPIIFSSRHTCFVYNCGVMHNWESAL